MRQNTHHIYQKSLLGPTRNFWTPWQVCLQLRPLNKYLWQISARIIIFFNVLNTCVRTDITEEVFEKFISEFFKRTHVEILLHGNLTEEVHRINFYRIVKKAEGYLLMALTVHYVFSRKLLILQERWKVYLMKIQEAKHWFLHNSRNIEKFNYQMVILQKEITLKIICFSWLFSPFLFLQEQIFSTKLKTRFTKVAAWKFITKSDKICSIYSSFFSFTIY